MVSQKHLVELEGKNPGGPIWKGIPNNLLKIIIIGHTDAKLCSRHKGELGPFVANNTGVSTWSPISAQLCIIYADYALDIYTSDVNNAGIGKIENNIRDGKTEHRWTNYILKLKNKNFMGIYMSGIPEAHTWANHVD